jgi:hypothetical protein
MKKFLSMILCAMMVLTLVACGSKDGGNAGSKEGDTMDLTAMVDKLYEGISADNMPMVMTQEVPADAFEGVFFIPTVEGATAVMSEPMMSSIAHSVCIMRVAEGTDVEATRAAIEANMNPRKWLCVEAEKSGVIANGNTILLVMTAEANYQTIVDNFNALWA